MRVGKEQVLLIGNGSLDAAGQKRLALLKSPYEHMRVWQCVANPIQLAECQRCLLQRADHACLILKVWWKATRYKGEILSDDLDKRYWSIGREILRAYHVPDIARFKLGLDIKLFMHKI